MVKILKILVKIYKKSHPTVKAWNILFLSKFRNFDQISKEHLNEYLMMFKILIQIFGISTKIRAYDVIDFDENFRHFDKILSL